MDNQKYLQELTELFGRKKETPKEPDDADPTFQIKIKGMPVKLNYYRHLVNKSVCKIDHKIIERKVNAVYEKVLKYACDDFYNNTYKQWRGDKAISYNEFKKKIKPVMVTVYADCELSVIFDDANLLSGHSLYVNLNKNYTPYETQMEG